MEKYSKIRNFLNGMESILEIYPVSESKILSDEEALKKDYEAILEDWYTVGNHMRDAMGLPRQKPKKNLTIKLI